MRVPFVFLVTCALGAGLAACVLFVPGPEETAGATCGLTSTELGTSCGACLVSKCQASLDRCCAEGKSCESAIAAVALCEDDEDECAVAGDGGAEVALRGCAVTSCASECGDGAVPAKDAGPETELVCRSGAYECFCSAVTDAGSASGSCVGGSGSYRACCASAGYPTTVESVCYCGPRYCLKSGSRCECGHFSSTSSEARSFCSTSSSFGTCCKSAQGSQCDCDDARDECPRDTTPVSGCSVSDLGCPTVDDKTATTIARCSN